MIYESSILLLGFICLTYGADSLVRGASKLAELFGISPLIIGLTIVAYGTSFPELAVSVNSSLTGSADVALGNVVGSNIFNILFILGISAIILPLIVQHQLVRQDVPIMIGVSILFFLCGMDRVIGRIDGTIFLILGFAYTGWLVWQSQSENSNSNSLPYEGGAPVKSLKYIGLNCVLIIVGLIFLVVGSRWVVSSAVHLSLMIGIPEWIVGVTIVAVGTSLPEAMTTIVATYKGERDIAVGNVVGSNIFNILIVLGVSGVVSSTGISVRPSAITVDIPIVVATACVCFPIFLSGKLISRKEGVFFLVGYLIYTVWLIVTANE